MHNFFTYYTNIKSMTHPFMVFSLGHLFYLVLTGFIIYGVYCHYCRLNDFQKLRFQHCLGVCFLLEEAIYIVWMLLNCHENVLISILPLELCSLCAYMNCICAFRQTKTLRFFCAVIGFFAGSIAMLYPVNISGIYPLISYRTINFYFLHGAILLFSFIQLKDRTLLEYHNLKSNYFIMCCMFSVAFVVNLMLGTQYMFVGIPPTIGIIASVYQLTGVVFFLPAIYIAIFLIQLIILAFLRLVLRNRNEEISYR